MRKELYLIVALSFIFCASLQSQTLKCTYQHEYFTTANGRPSSLQAQTLKCTYLHEYSRTEKRKLFRQDLRLCVESDGEYAICYSENEYLRDSLATLLFAEGFDRFAVQEKTNIYPDGVEWVVMGHPAEGTFREIYKIAFLYIEGRGEYVQPQWTICHETENLCGFPCTKAVGEYLGREWQIWFTSEIPLNLGPWLLWGAPGMILKAEDTDGLFRFTCEEICITTHNRRVPLEEKFEGQKAKPHPSYYVYDFKEAEQMNNKAERDIQLADEMMGMYGETYDANGNKVTPKIPYIPLIPDEYWE